MSHYMELSKWNYMIILGIAISGMAAWQSTYDAASGINKEIIKCEQSTDLQNKLEAKFIATMIISSIAVVIGILLSWFVRNYFLTFGVGLATAGVFGIVFGLSEKFREASNEVKLITSWSSLLLFVAIGFFMDWESSKGTTSVELPDLSSS